MKFLPFFLIVDFYLIPYLFLILLYFFYLSLYCFFDFYLLAFYFLDYSYHLGFYFLVCFYDFLDSYLLIKGDKNLLDEKTNKLFLGYKENKFGFVGLINKVNVDSFSKFEKEKADIESIMVLLERGNK